jgi:hypothetical protein
VVDIDAEAQAGRVPLVLSPEPVEGSKDHYLRLPGFTAGTAASSGGTSSSA